MTFKKIYSYLIKYTCIQSKIFIFNEKYFHSNTLENFKSWVKSTIVSRYVLSFGSVRYNSVTVPNK